MMSLNELEKVDILLDELAKKAAEYQKQHPEAGLAFAGPMSITFSGIRNNSLIVLKFYLPIPSILESREKADLMDLFMDVITKSGTERLEIYHVFDSQNNDILDAPIDHTMNSSSLKLSRNMSGIGQIRYIGERDVPVHLKSLDIMTMPSDYLNSVAIHGKVIFRYPYENGLWGEKQYPFQLKTLSYIEKTMPPLCRFMDAGKKGDLVFFQKWESDLVLLDTASYIIYMTFTEAAKNGSLEIIRYLASNIKVESTHVDAAFAQSIRNSHIIVADFLESDNRISSNSVLSAYRFTLLDGNSKMSERLEKSKKSDALKEELYYMKSAFDGQLPVMKKLEAAHPMSTLALEFALELAAAKGKMDVVKDLLLRYELDNSATIRAILSAEKFNHKDVSHFICESTKISPDIYSEVLRIYAERDDLESVQGLLKCNTVDQASVGKALRNARSSGATKVVEYLSEVNLVK